MNIHSLLSNSKVKSVFILVMSFLAPALILLAAYAKMGLYPFGDKSILIMDMSGNFVDYFAQLRHVVQGDSSIFYSWSKALGGSYIGIFAFSVSSPLSLITLLFPENMLTTAILVINVIKIGLAGLTFCLYLKYIFKKNDLSLVIFSLFYGLIAYSIAFSMCIMWLDGVIWLPVVLIGIEKLISKNKPILLIVSLFILFISSYYISYMVGIFSVIYFIYRYLTEYSHMGAKLFIIRFSKFIISAVVSAGLAAWFLLPVLYSLRQGKMDTLKYVFTLNNNFTLIDLSTKFFIGSYDSITSSGLPGIFCGTIVLILVPGYFFIKSISLREKLLSAIIIGFMILSFYFTSINVAWHVFQFPNWFPYRYSFIFSFFLLYIAYKAFTQIREIPLNAYISSIALFSLVALFILKIKYPFLISKYIYLTFFFLILYIIILNILKHQLEQTKAQNKINIALILTCLLFVAVLEMVMNTRAYVNCLDKEFHYIENSSYTDFNKKLEPLVEKAKSSEKTFFRLEKTFERSKNDAIGLNYNGISHYSAAYDRNVNSFLKKLGFSQDHFWSSYYGSTIFTDSLLGVKYILSETPLNSYYTPVESNENITMYQNPYALSLGFMADDSLLGVELKDKEHLQNQNNILKAITKTNNDYFVGINDIQTITENLTIESKVDFATYTKNSAKEAYVAFKFDAPADNPIYASFPRDYREACELFVNSVSKGIVFAAGETINNIYVGTFNKGELIEIKLVLKNSTLTIQKKFICYIDMPLYEKAIDSIKQNQLNITHYNNTKVEGTVKVTDKTLLFTSIPFDEGWTIKVDGKKVPAQRFADTLMCIKLPVGAHKIEMSYLPQGLTYGSIVSITTFTLLCASMIFVKQKIIK